MSIDHEMDIWKMFNSDSTKTSVPLAVRLERYHEKFKVMWRPFCVLASLDLATWMGPIGNLVSLNASRDCSRATNTKRVFCLMCGCQTSSPWCHCICKKRNIKKGRQYSPWCVQAAIKKGNIAEQVIRDFDLALHLYRDRDHSVMAELR